MRDYFAINTSTTAVLPVIILIKKSDDNSSFKIAGRLVLKPLIALVQSEVDYL